MSEFMDRKASERGPAEDGLVTALRALGRAIGPVPEPDLAEAVLARVRAESVTGSGRARGEHRYRRPRAASLRARRTMPWRWLVPLAAAVTGGAVVVGATPAGSGLSHWFAARGVVVTERPARPGSDLPLGTLVAFSTAQRTLAAPIPWPRQFGRPDAVYVTGPAKGRIVSLVWRPRPGLVASTASADVGLLLSVFVGRSQPVIQKGVGPGTTLDVVNVERGGRSVPATYIAGRPHDVAYLDAEGSFHLAPVFLAGPVLLWEEGPLTIRLESGLDKGAAVELAARLR